VGVRATGKVTHKFDKGWEVGVIKFFDKKGPHAGKSSKSSMFLTKNGKFSNYYQCRPNFVLKQQN
jgi:hypothetical protein